MHVRRPFVCLAVVASLLAAGSASAATKPKPKPKPPVCNLVVDPAGDSSTKDDALDIISADVATDAKYVTAVIRVKKLGLGGLNSLGGILRMTFDLPNAEAPIWLGYTNSVYGGETFQYGLIGKGTGGSTSPTGEADGIVDAAKNEVRISVRTVDMNVLGNAKPGAKVSNLEVTASQIVGLAPNETGTYGHLSQAADSATGKNYVAGTKSCVTPGK